MTHYKIFILGIISLMASCSIEAEVLPTPQTTGGKPLMQVMSERKSSRDYQENQTVTKQDLSNMLWAAWGITHDGKRTIATAMNRQELVLYVITPTEVSRYNPDANTLTIVNTGDFRKYCTMQDFAAIAPINIVLAVDVTKQSKPEFQAYTAGAASQNIYLYCAAHNLATVCRASMDKEKLKKGLGLSDSMTLHLNHPVGHFAGSGAAPATDARSAARARVEKDVKEYGRDGMREIERLYRAYSSKASDSALATLLEKYPKANRTGCAVMYAAQRASGENRVKLLEQAIANHGDCVYGDGAQVGAYARMYLAGEFERSGDTAGAEKLYGEIRALYPNARTHKGRPLSEILPAAK